MSQILFLPNEWMLIWLPVDDDDPAGPAGPARLDSLARMVRDGRWTLPPELARRYAGTGRLDLRARVCGEVLVVWPASAGGPPDPSAAPLRLSDLSAEQVQLLRLLAGGRTKAQVASALARSPRWVRRQVQLVKQRAGAQTRAQLLALLLSVHGFRSAG